MNETFEQETEALQVRDCDRTAIQCVNVSSAVTMEPSTSLGTVVVTCRGVPEVVCETNEEGTSCVVTMTQQLCVSMPVRYSVELTTNDSTIACAGDGAGTCTCNR